MWVLRNELKSSSRQQVFFISEPSLQPWRSYFNINKVRFLSRPAVVQDPWWGVYIILDKCIHNLRWQYSNGERESCEDREKKRESERERVREREKDREHSCLGNNVYKEQDVILLTCSLQIQKHLSVQDLASLGKIQCKPAIMTRVYLPICSEI